MYSTHSILIALRDGALGIVLILLMSKNSTSSTAGLRPELADGNDISG